LGITSEPIGPGLSGKRRRGHDKKTTKLHRKRSKKGKKDDRKLQKSFAPIATGEGEEEKRH